MISKAFWIHDVSWRPTWGLNLKNWNWLEAYCSSSSTYAKLKLSCITINIWLKLSIKRFFTKRFPLISSSGELVPLKHFVWKQTMLFMWLLKIYFLSLWSGRIVGEGIQKVVSLCINKRFPSRYFEDYASPGLKRNAKMNGN